MMKLLNKLKSEIISDYKRTKHKISAHDEFIKAKNKDIINNHNITRARIDDIRQDFKSTRYK